jgi:hypothetical protein
VLLALIVALAVPGAEAGFAWGNRPPVIARDAATPPREGLVAKVVSVHAAVDGADLVLRFTFDRPVQRAMYAESGAPVSGRLRAILYVDADDNRKTGLLAAANDPRAGADRRLEVGVVAVGADPEENLGSSAVVTAALSDLAGKRRRSRWRGDAAATPRQVVTGARFVEVRLTGERGPWKRTSRVVLAEDDVLLEGRLKP